MIEKCVYGKSSNFFFLKNSYPNKQGKKLSPTVPQHPYIYIYIYIYICMYVTKPLFQADIPSNNGYVLLHSEVQLAIYEP